MLHAGPLSPVALRRTRAKPGHCLTRVLEGRLLTQVLLLLHTLVGVRSLCQWGAAGGRTKQLEVDMIPPPGQSPQQISPQRGILQYPDNNHITEPQKGLGLKGPYRPSSFKPPAMDQHLPLEQPAQSSIQPGLLCFQGWATCSTASPPHSKEFPPDKSNETFWGKRGKPTSS